MEGLCEGEWGGRAELDLWKGCGEGGGGVVSCGGGMGEFGWLIWTPPLPHVVNSPLQDSTGFVFST